MSAITGGEYSDNTSPALPVWLTQAWLEPRLVLVTFVALISSVAGERAGLAPELILLLNVISYVAGGLYGVKSALESLREGTIDIDLLMVLAAVGAAIIGEWHEGAMLLFLFSLSNVLQDYAIGRSRSAIKSLFKLYPEEAIVRRDGTEQAVKSQEIRLTDVVLIKPGERIPVDGDVLNGRSAVDESPITGESIPVDKVPGQQVFAGTLNKQGILDVKPSRLATDTTLARIITMVENAQENQAPTERFLDTFEQYYAMFIIVATILFIIVPPALGLVDFDSNFYRAMVLMTVASPCALVISVPAAFISAIASAARGGVLFKGGAYLEKLAEVKAIAFDKTGTLTIGEPRMTDIHVYNGMSEDNLLALAASVENRSEHPLARAVVMAAKERDLTLTDVSDFEALTGQGVRAKLNDDEIILGSIAAISDITPVPEALATQQRDLENSGKTVMGVLKNGEWMGVIAMADMVRPQAAKVVADLKAKGIEVAMLTGDNERVAQTIAQQVGITRVHAGLMPDEKVSVVQKMQEELGSVAMIGDGVNDAPALAIAEVGIAMGAAGTDVAMETADVVLMGDRIEGIEYVIDLSKKARRVVWQNIIFALAVIAILIPGVFLVNLPLPLGVLGHEGSTVIVVLNGLISLLLIPEIQRRRSENRRADKVRLQTA